MPAVRITALEAIRSLRAAPDQERSAAAPLELEDRARVLIAFLGQPTRTTSPMHYLRAAADGDSSAYVFDYVSGMVYVLE